MRSIRIGLALLLGLAFSGPVAVAEDAKESPDEVVRKGLAKKLTVNFDATSLDQVLTFVQDLTGINLVVDLALDTKQTVTLQLEDVTVRSLLDLATASVDDVTYAIWRGTLFFTSRKNPKPAPPPADLTDAARKLASRPVSLNFPRTPLRDAVAFVSDITGMKLVVDRAVEDRIVSFRLKDLSVEAALDVICRLAGLKVEKKGEANVITARE